MRIAAIDLGSNSFHLVVVEARLDGSFSPLVREKEMLRLGDVVALTGSIGPEPMRGALEVLRRFKAIAEAHHADEVVALATAAIREALDGGEFVDRARDELGIDVEVVDGTREAELIFTAIRSSVLIDPGPALAADLGGGSLEIMVGDRNAIDYATSVRLGVGRLTAELVTSDPPSQKNLKGLRARIAEELEPVLAEVAELKPRILIGSSGTFVSLGKMAAALRDGTVPDSINQLTVSRGDVEALNAELLGRDAVNRARLPGCDPKRSELLPAGAAVLLHLMEATGLDELTLSEWALREGIVIQAIGKHDRADLAEDPRAIRRSSVLSLCRRSGWRQAHARKVAQLAVELFDATTELHRLDPDERELLELGALLHDIGEHVSRTDHDRHTAYLIENGGLRGFSPREIRLLASIGRYHVRGAPKVSFESFALLDAADRVRATKLAALLRVADALDATHADTVEHIELDRRGLGEGVCHLVARSRGAAELELWTVRRKKELFERIFSIECDVRREPVGTAGYNRRRAGAIGLG